MQLVPTGIGIGSVIAVVCSWERNHSILRAAMAGVLSWIYVFYFVMTRGRKAVQFTPPIPQFPLGIERDRPLRPTKKE